MKLHIFILYRVKLFYLLNSDRVNFDDVCKIISNRELRNIMRINFRKYLNVVDNNEICDVIIFPKT